MAPYRYAMLPMLAELVYEAYVAGDHNPDIIAAEKVIQEAPKAALKNALDKVGSFVVSDFIDNLVYV